MRSKLRVAFAALLMGWMFVGPLLWQVFGLRHGALRPWVMFQAGGKMNCDVRLYELEPSGELVRLDRAQTLGFADVASLPPDLRKAKKLKHVDHQLRRACRQNPELELRAMARCGGMLQWRERYSTDQDLCELESLWTQ